MTLNVANLFNRAQLECNTDWFAIAVVTSLPWSTSATTILIVLWFIATIFTFNRHQISRIVMTSAGGLPVLLLALGVVGMLWADVSFKERLHGVDSFIKLLMIPLLFLQFHRSERGHLVFAAYVVSCGSLLVMSSAFYAWPGITFLFSHDYGVPVKNAATQSGEFVTCIFGLLYVAIDSFERGRRIVTIGALLLGTGFMANIAFVATARTPLITIPFLLLLLGLKKLQLRGAIGLVAVGMLLATVTWVSSSYLRHKVLETFDEVRVFRAQDVRNSSGERLEFARKSIDFISQAPWIGHGTGTIAELFRRSAVGQTGAAAFVTTNPHNQIFAIAIQLGLIGAVVLCAMWIAHLLLFRGSGLVEWIGLLLVVQNIVGSLFNSHLFDFVQGWTYVFGVGVAGGMVLRLKRAARENARDPTPQSP